MSDARRGLSGMAANAWEGNYLSTKLVHRPARLLNDPLPVEPLKVARVPSIDSSSSGGPMAMRALLPVVGGLGMMAMMMSSGNPIRMIAGGAMVCAALLGAVAMLIYAKTGGRKKAEQQRGHYIEFIADKRRALDQEIADQKALVLRRHPNPVDLLQVVRNPSRLWERRRDDADFLTLRIGNGVGPLARAIDTNSADDDPMRRPEPIAQAHFQRYLRATERIDGLPIAVPVFGVVSIVGPTPKTHQTLRALLAQLAVFHAPDDVRIHLALPKHGANDSVEWALWLPHLLDPTHFDGPLGRRQTSRNLDDLIFLGDEIARRKDELGERGKRYGPDNRVAGHHLVIVVDNDDPHGHEILQILPPPDELHALRLAVIVLNEQRILEPGHVDVRVMFGDDGLAEVAVIHEPDTGVRVDAALERERRLVRGAVKGAIDTIDSDLAATLARRLAPIRLVADAAPEAPLETTITLDGLLGFSDLGSYDIAEAWQPRGLDDFLNVPFGVDSTGQPVNLNLKESAQGGMGPHGLCVGATGSGKSEVLRTMVLSQAICHSPERLALVLVDYKGGAAFAGLDQLPHTSAMVDNLSDDAGLVDRLHDALLGEMQRRQQVLQAAGALPNVTEYNRRRDAGQKLEPLPDLLVVIDEFGEILTAKPDFIDLFVQIGRIGRSIGVHLLLATQRLEEGRLRGLESHLSYRIGLRTFSAQESRAAIGAKDAHELPAIPGSGILKVDPDIFARFKAAYVSGTYVPVDDAENVDLPPVPMPFTLDNVTGEWLQQRETEYQVAAKGQTVTSNDDPFSETTLDVVARRLGQAAPPVRQIWLPPLPESLDFSDVVGPTQRTRQHGLSVADLARRGTLSIPIGLKDRPLKQWQGPLDVDLSGSGGHLAIMGSPQSGKTGAIRALVVGGALTHTPTEIAFYVVDMAGSSLMPLQVLPHVGDVATRFEADKVRRTIAEMMTHLTMRERIFAEHRIENVDQMRDLHRHGGLPEISCADLFLVIDGWWTFREEFEELASLVQEISARGLGYGIHVVFTTSRWADFRVQMQGLIGSKIELRLNDAMDSSIGRKVVESIKADNPGRCVTGDRLFGQICLPGYEGTFESTLEQIAAAWNGTGAAPVRMLPERIDIEQLRREHPMFPHIIAGIAESDLMPVRVDLLGEDQHLLVYGDSGSGKTTLARTIIAEMCPRFGEGELVFAVLDLKRQLMDAVPKEFVGGYAGTAPAAAQLVQSIIEEIKRRFPPNDVTAAQLRERSWWTGPEVVIIADDYDLMEGPNSPLRPLVPYLTQARDLGLHLVVTRRSGGAGRSQFENTLQGLRESGATGVVLSGDRQEGQLWPKLWMSPQIPGRGHLIRRGGSAQRIQLAFSAPSEELSTHQIGVER